jgi:hypothetical protein
LRSLWSRQDCQLSDLHPRSPGCNPAKDRGCLDRPQVIPQVFPAALPADQIEVKSWPPSLAPGQAEVRAHEIYNKPGSNDLSARGSMEWMRLDNTAISSNPIRSASDVLPNDADPDSAPRTIQFPEAPPPPSGVFTQSRRVAWCELGLDSQLTPAACLEYMIECAIQSGRYGWSFETSQALDWRSSCAAMDRDLSPSMGVQQIDTWLSDMKAPR